ALLDRRQERNRLAVNDLARVRIERYGYAGATAKACALQHVANQCLVAQVYAVERTDRHDRAVVMYDLIESVFSFHFSRNEPELRTVRRASTPVQRGRVRWRCAGAPRGAPRR